MMERPTPSGTVRNVPRAAEPIARFSGHGIYPDPSHHTPLPDVPQALLARPTPDVAREAAQPLPRERAARRFEDWRSDPNRRPAFAFEASSDRPIGIAAALACPDLFLLDTPLGQERLQAIVALIEGGRSGGQRLAILTSNPANANAIVLALPAEGVGRARASSENELPPVVAEQTAEALARREWDHRRSARLSDRQRIAKQLNWWKEWDRLAEAEPTASPPSVESDSMTNLAAEKEAKIEHWKAAECADAEVRKALESQLAEWKSHPVVPGGLGGFIKRLFGGAKADPQIAAAEAKLRELDAAATARHRELADIDAHYRTLSLQIVAEEQTRTHTIRTEQLGDLQRQRDALNHTRPTHGREQLRMTLSDLDAELAEPDHPPSSPTRESMHRLAAVVGPFSALDSDPFFAPTHPEAEPAFDRVVFADAEDLGEAEFTRAARLGNAWTLLGSLDLPRPAHRNGKPGRGEFFRDTFDAVSATPWRRENGRLVALLTDGDSRALRSEPLADNPAIQLRFRDRSDGETELAEVAFPPIFTLIEAKRFLLAELDSPKSQFLGVPEWTATADAVQCSWPGEGTAFELSSGIRESLNDGFTTRFEFANSAGWTRESAEAWYAEHFGHRAGTRAVRVTMGR